MLHMFHTYVASILSRCCIYFTMVFKCFPDIFASVSNTCFKCFIYLQKYVVSVASKYFTSRSDVASPSSLSVALPRCLLLAPGWVSAALPLFSMLVMLVATRAPCEHVKWRGKRSVCAGVRTLGPSECLGASKTESKIVLHACSRCLRWAPWSMERRMREGRGEGRGGRTGRRSS